MPVADLQLHAKGVFQASDADALVKQVIVIIFLFLLQSNDLLEYFIGVAGKGFNETASALIGELYKCSTGGRAAVYSYRWLLL